MDLFEMVIALILFSYILGLLIAAWMFNRQTKLVELFKLDNQQLENENLNLKQQVASLTRRNKELDYSYTNIDTLNKLNSKRIELLKEDLEKFSTEIMILRNQVIKSESANAAEKVEA